MVLSRRRRRSREMGETSPKSDSRTESPDGIGIVQGRKEILLSKGGLSVGLLQWYRRRRRRRRKE